MQYRITSCRPFQYPVSSFQKAPHASSEATYVVVPRSAAELEEKRLPAPRELGPEPERGLEEEEPCVEEEEGEEEKVVGE